MSLIGVICTLLDNELFCCSARNNSQMKRDLKTYAQKQLHDFQSKKIDDFQSFPFELRFIKIRNF